MYDKYIYIYINVSIYYININIIYINIKIYKYINETATTVISSVKKRKKEKNETAS